jgi:putative transposase
MHTVSYRRHRFPPDIIQNAVWLYFRFPLSFRDVEDLLAERGIDVSYETVRRWSVKFGLAYARKLRRSHPPADTRWHLDEVFVSINGRSMYLWRAVDCEGEVLDVLVQQKKQEGRTETDAETAEDAGLRTGCDRDGQPAFLWCRAERSRNERRTHHGRTKQQPGGELSPANPAERTTNAEVQVRCVSPEISFNACRRLQQLQRPASSHLP